MMAMAADTASSRPSNAHPGLPFSAGHALLSAAAIDSGRARLGGTGMFSAMFDPITRYVYRK
jgi:hypothetical protein